MARPEHIDVRTRAAAAALLLVLSGCGRDEPQLFAVVQRASDAAGDCLPLRPTSLAGLTREELARARLPDGEYFWLVGEAFEGPGGLDAALSSLTGGSALVSLTASSAGRSATRAVATVENGRVTHTYFGTPLTPAFAHEPGAQLTLTFDARLLDRPGLGAAKAVLDSVPLDGAAYLKLLAAVAPAAPKGQEASATSHAQTYVLRDPRACGSGACQAVIADERLVALSAVPGKTAVELAPKLCLRGGRLFEIEDMDEHSGAYAVLRVAHAPLPEEALGEPLAEALASLARCDRDFAPELAGRALDLVARAEALRPSDREALHRLLDDTALAAKARTAEERLEAERRLGASSARVCGDTPADGIVCARAKSIASCGAARATFAAAARDAYRAAAASVDRAEHAATSAGTCEERGQALVGVAVDLAALATAARAAKLEGACQHTSAGLSCEAFPDLSRRSKAAVADAQDALYRQCFCAPIARDRSGLAAARLVREALRCEATPEEFNLSPAPEAPLGEVEVSAWQAHRATLVPSLTAQQCPACVRLTRRLDDELARAVMLGQSQAAVTGLLRQALAPVTALHDRAFVLMTGEAARRCSARPEEWSVIARALAFNVEPRDLFRPGGNVDPSRLEAKLKEAELLKTSLEGLPCARTGSGVDGDDEASLAVLPP